MLEAQLVALPFPRHKTNVQDPEVWTVAVLDLTSCSPRRPHGSSAAGGAGATPGGLGAPGAAPGGGARQEDCTAVLLDPQLFAARPGLQVLQAGWHPDSDSHLALLTSDSVWRLYNVRSPGLAEQTFKLSPPGRRGGLGLDSGGGGGAAVVAFSFGAAACWERFSVYFLTRRGQVFTLCPVVPFGTLLAGGARGKVPWALVQCSAVEGSCSRRPPLPVRRRQKALPF